MASTANMSLILPVPSVTLGPEWASTLNDALSLVDSHDHSSGKGIKITPPGLNINSDLTFNTNNINSAKSLRLTSNTALLAGTLDVRSVYSKDGDLYYNNASGTAVQITSGSSTTSGAAGPSSSYSRTTSSSATFNINPSDTFSYIELITLSNAITVNLPAANSVSAGRFFFVKDSYGNAGTNNITIVPNGVNQIDGTSSVVLSGNYDAVQVISDGVARWNVYRVGIADNSVTLAKLDRGVLPAGMVSPFSTAAAPTGWLLCDGSAVARSTYSDLFTAIGITHGQGDGSTTFNLPDYRGQFLRMVDGAANRDPDKTSRTAMNTGGNTGNNVGSVQDDMFESHSHPYSQWVPSTNAGSGWSVNDDSYRQTESTYASGGNETRPTNAYVIYCVKF